MKRTGYDWFLFWLMVICGGVLVLLLSLDDVQAAPPIIIGTTDTLSMTFTYPTLTESGAMIDPADTDSAEMVYRPLAVDSTGGNPFPWVTLHSYGGGWIPGADAGGWHVGALPFGPWAVKARVSKEAVYAVTEFDTLTGAPADSVRIPLWGPWARRFVFSLYDFEGGRPRRVEGFIGEVKP